jgi:hypothetical protein
MPGANSSSASVASAVLERRGVAAYSAGEAPPGLRLKLAAVGQRHLVMVGLVGIVMFSAIFRWLASLAHVVPYYFADEYVYSALSRGIADQGVPVVRGSLVAFPALLEPLQTAAFYLLASDISTAFRLTQALHALETSIAAVPMFLIARRLGLSHLTALGCGAIAVASPGLFWSSFAMADAVAYTLALTAFYCAVRVLDEPRLGSQLAFVAATGLATFARAQYAVLFIAVLLAALVVERGALRQVARQNWVTLMILTIALAAVGLVGFWDVLGPYAGFIGAATDPRVVAASFGLEVLVVTCAAGIVVIPGAMVGLDLMLSRPRTRSERAFAAFTLFTGAFLVALAALIASLERSAGSHERYLIVLIPLPALFFAVWVERGMPRRGVAIVLAVAAGLALALVDLPSWRADHSSTLQALHRFGELAGSTAIVRAAAGALALVSVLLITRFRGHTAATLAVAAAGMTVLSFGAYSFDRANAGELRAGQLPENKEWLDELGLRHATLLHAPGARRGSAIHQLFWSRSLDRVVELRGSDQLDFFATYDGRIAPDGQLLVGQKPTAGPLLVPVAGAAFTFVGSKVVRRIPEFELVTFAGSGRVATAIFGRYRDGWAKPRSLVSAWPRSAPSSKRLRIVFSLPKTASEPVRVDVSGRGVKSSVVVRPGNREIVFVPISARSPLRLKVAAKPTVRIGNRVVAVQVSRPRLVG